LLELFNFVVRATVEVVEVFKVPFLLLHEGLERVGFFKNNDSFFALHELVLLGGFVGELQVVRIPGFGLEELEVVLGFEEQVVEVVGVPLFGLELGVFGGLELTGFKEGTDLVLLAGTSSGKSWLWIWLQCVLFLAPM